MPERSGLSLGPTASCVRSSSALSEAAISSPMRGPQGCVEGNQAKQRGV